MSTIAVAGESGNAYSEIADAASVYFALEGGAEVELVFASPEEIQSVNNECRGVNSVTDVLSFPALELVAGEYKPFSPDNYPFDVDPDSGRIGLGSILICGEVAEKQAAEYGHGVMREKGYLFLHGLLHLLGFDHMNDGDKAAMRTAEEGILAKVGLTR